MVRSSRVAVLFMLLAASTGGGCTPDPADVFTQVCAPSVCAAPTTVTDGAGFIARIPAAWTLIAEYSAGCLPASDDIAVTGSITVAGTDIAPPPSPLCSGGPCEPPAFLLRGGVPGVECLDQRPFFDFNACGSVRITNTTVRMRTVQRDIHPAPGNFIPLVELMGPCEAACAPNELSCEEAHTCWARPRDYCAYCLGGSNAHCACWGGDDFVENGTACEVYLSGDVISPGTCQAGVCELSQ